jgi:curved DNA-binding protein
VESKDYYNILGINKKATEAEIKKAFRALAVKLHPDKNPNDKEAENKFKLVNEANGVLSNPEKRKKYDEFGADWEHQQANNQSNGNPFGGNSDSGFGREQYYRGADGSADFSDVFEQFFGANANQGAKNRKGGDYETEMEITLEEAYSGTSRIIQVENEKLRISTKPGTQTDQLLKIKSKGANGTTAANRGDLYVRIKIKPHQLFVRKGDNLHETIIIDLYTAVLGGEITVETLTGKVKIPIAVGTQNNKTIRLKGKGMPSYEKKDVFGDLYIQIEVKIPEILSQKQKELFEELKSTSS